MQAETISIEALLLKSQLRWVGHVARMEDHRLPKVVLYGELSSGHRNIVGPKKRCKDCLKKSLCACHIDQHQWSTLASNHDKWRHTIDGAVSAFERNRQAVLEEKRRKRKNINANGLDNWVHPGVEPGLSSNLPEASLRSSAHHQCHPIS